MEQTQEFLVLDFWQDTVMYQGKIMPIGTIGCEALFCTGILLSKS